MLLATDVMVLLTGSAPAISKSKPDLQILLWQLPALCFKNRWCNVFQAFTGPRPCIDQRGCVFAYRW